MSVIENENDEIMEEVPYFPGWDIREWHAATDVGLYSEQPDAYAKKQTALLRLSLISEEGKEVADELLDFANGKGDIHKLAKELADLLYVTHAAADVFGIPIEEVWNEVHRSNMTKVGEDGMVVRRADGKILKGENYEQADIASIF